MYEAASTLGWHFFTILAFHKYSFENYEQSYKHTVASKFETYYLEYKTQL